MAVYNVITINYTFIILISYNSLIILVCFPLMHITFTNTSNVYNSCVVLFWPVWNNMHLNVVFAVLNNWHVFWTTRRRRVYRQFYSGVFIYYYIYFSVPKSSRLDEILRRDGFHYYFFFRRFASVTNNSGPFVEYTTHPHTELLILRVPLVY